MIGRNIHLDLKHFHDLRDRVIDSLAVVPRLTRYVTRWKSCEDPTWLNHVIGRCANLLGYDYRSRVNSVGYLQAKLELLVAPAILVEECTTDFAPLSAATMRSSEDKFKTCQYDTVSTGKSLYYLPVEIGRTGFSKGPRRSLGPRTGLDQCGLEDLKPFSTACIRSLRPNVARSYTPEVFDLIQDTLEFFWRVGFADCLFLCVHNNQGYRGSLGTTRTFPLMILKIR